MTVTITFAIDDAGAAVTTHAATPGMIAGPAGFAEAEAPPTLVGGPDGPSRGELDGSADDLPPLEPAELGLGADFGAGGGGGPAPSDDLVDPDTSDAGGSSEPMPLEELEKAAGSAGRRPSRAK
jgi:hypothetical protein